MGLSVQAIAQPEDTIIELLPYQDDFIFSPAPYPAAVTAWGTGKTFAGIVKAMHLSEQSPGNLGIIFRKQYVDLRDSTVRDFEENTGLKVDSQRNVELPNGSSIMFRHIEEMHNIQNINLGWFWIEQAEELESDEQYFKLFGRLRRKGMSPCGFLTANAAGHNWIWRLWKRGDFAETIRKLIEKSPETFAHLAGQDLTKLAPIYEADTFANRKNLSPAFMAGLEIMRMEKPHLYNRFVLNSHDEGDTVDIIISPKVVNECIGRELTYADQKVRKVISIDVARKGDDKSVLKLIENYAEVETQQYEKKSTMELVGYAVMMARKHGITPAEKDEHGNVLKPSQGGFAVDEIGVGGGPADRLAELGYHVVFVNASERTGVRVGCFNRRAEIYLNGAELAEAHRISILPSDTELCEQLSWAKYKTIKSNGVYQVESKDDIKARMGRSPDDADSFLNGLWALPQVRPMDKADKYERNFIRARKPITRSAMTV